MFFQNYLVSFQKKQIEKIIYQILIPKKLEMYLPKIIIKPRNLFLHIILKITLVIWNKKCIFAPLINRGRVPQNLITRLCQ